VKKTPREKGRKKKYWVVFYSQLYKHLKNSCQDEHKEKGIQHKPQKTQSRIFISRNELSPYQVEQKVIKISITASEHLQGSFTLA
jgi:hypothetical protein